MFKIKGNEIYLTRGDSAEFSVNLKYLDGRQYVMAEGDTLIFSMRKERSSEVELELVFDGTNIVSLAPSDTQNLDFGKYKYEVELVTAYDKVYTVIAWADLFLEHEVILNHLPV